MGESCLPKRMLAVAANGIRGHGMIIFDFMINRFECERIRIGMETLDLALDSVLYNRSYITPRI